MADVILVQPTTLNRELGAPLGLMALAAYLESYGYEVTILDVRLEADYQERLLQLVSQDPIAIGITCLTGSQISSAMEVSCLVKSRNKRLPVIWGGIHPSCLPRQTLENPNIDIVVRGEGEETLLETINALKNGSDLGEVKGLTYKEGRLICENPDRPFLDMDQLPIPAWHLIDVSRHIEGVSRGNGDRLINMATSRSCPHRCTFCYNLSLGIRPWRARNPSLVLEELKYLTDNFKVNRIMFQDDNFATDKRRAMAIAQGIKEKGLDLKWIANLRVDYFDKEWLSEMKEGGLNQLLVGAESGSQTILELIKKDTTVEQIRLSAAIAKEIDLRVNYTLVIGWPGETKEERCKTIKLMLELGQINPQTVSSILYFYTPYPGNPLYDKAVEVGFKPPDRLEAWSNFSWQAVNIPWIKDKRKFETIGSLSPLASLRVDLGKAFNGFHPGQIALALGAILVRSLVRFRLKHEFVALSFEPFLVKIGLWLKRQLHS
ncbi:B12-binding domain-containing radical SAM protein [Chloroflexota bacterium]